MKYQILVYGKNKKKSDKFVVCGIHLHRGEYSFSNVCAKKKKKYYKIMLFLNNG